MSMYCQTCGTDMMGGCDCDHWDFATPISALRVRTSGDTTDPWAARDFSQYTAEIEFGGEVVEIPLSFRDNREEDKFDAPRPTKRFLKNLNRNEWTVVKETGDETVYEIPNPYYTAKLVRVPKKNHFALIADAVDLNPDDEWRDCYTGGRAYLVFSLDDGEALLDEYADHFTPSGGGSQSRPYDTMVDDDRNPCDWVYADYSASDDITDSARSQKVPAADR